MCKEVNLEVINLGVEDVVITSPIYGGKYNSNDSNNGETIVSGDEISPGEEDGIANV